MVQEEQSQVGVQQDAGGRKPRRNSTVVKAETIEISVKGEWQEVPALAVDGVHLTVRGKWLRKAIVEGEEWLPSELQDPDACVRALKAQTSGPLRSDVFTFVQKLPATEPKYPYPMEWHSLAVARITTFDDWWAKLPQESRKNVRRATKRGVEVVVKRLDDELVRSIVDVNNDSPVRQNIRFVHYGKTFEQVRKDQSTYADRSDFICAYVGTELIGFMKLVYGGQTASILQMLPRASHADKRPANALIAKAVEVCAAKGVPYLVYGMLNYGNKRQSSLRDFKLRNGFEGMCVPRYYVPINMWGRLCVKMNLHRGALGVLPPAAIASAVRIRAWYNRLRGKRRCSSNARAAES